MVSKPGIIANIWKCFMERFFDENVSWSDEVRWGGEMMRWGWSSVKQTWMDVLFCFGSRDSFEGFFLNYYILFFVSFLHFSLFFRPPLTFPHLCFVLFCLFGFVLYCFVLYLMIIESGLVWAQKKLLRKRICSFAPNVLCTERFESGYAHWVVPNH